MSENSVTQVNLYKVLRDGASCHGGSLTWPLPTQGESGEWIPGAWVSLDTDRPLKLCAYALHLTDQPASWYLPDAQCWLVEYRGETVGELSGGWGSKIGVREARLLRPVAWEDVAVWSSGDHTLRTGVGWAYGSATVRASDSATVRASGSATVQAYDSATVRAYGSATVRASDSATVRASDSATVEASDSATVEASDSATVRAYGSATVRASDSATVEASDSATVRAYGSATVVSTLWHSDSAQVALNQMAAHVDRRGGKVVCRVAEAAS